MIRKLIQTIKRTHHSKNNFAFLAFFALLSVFALNCKAQTRGGKGVNTIIQKPITGNTYAIIFGVSNYPGLTPLKYADKDAELFRDFLETPAGGNTKPENIFFRTNENAKAANFNVDAYGWLKSKGLKEGDRLYIYLSGHGDAMNEEVYFFLPYDCMPNKDNNNYLGTGNVNMAVVKSLFIKPLSMKKVDVVLILDACRTNDLPGGEQGQQSFVNYMQSIAEQNEGEITMLSTGAGQVAIESAKIGNGHGLFTWYLVAGLSGDADKEGDAADHDGKVSLAELSSYVKNHVRKDAKNLFNTDQVPVFLPPDKDLETLAMVDSGTYANWKLADNMMKQTNGNDNSVAIVNKKPGKKAVEEGGFVDTALITLDNKFITAIKTGKLLGKSSAEEFYDKMVEKWPGQSITEDAKYSLATEFINFGQEKINLYLSGKGITHIQHLENAYRLNDKLKSTKSKDSVKNIPTTIEDQIVRMKTIVSTGYDVAAEMMEKAVDLLKKDPELLEPLYPKLYFLKASSLQYSTNTSKKNQAIAFARKAIEKDVAAAYNYELLGDLLHSLDNDSCKIYYQKAIELAPKWAYPENGLGNFYNDKKNHDLAIVHYNNAIRLDSLDEFVYQNIGSMYHNEARPDSAKKYYLKALSIDSCDFYADANLGSLYKDSLAYKKNPYYFNLSNKYLKKAIACNASYAWAYNKIAQLFDLVGKGDSSIYYSKQGVLKNPDDASLLRNLGNEYLFQKDTLNAETFYKKALATDTLDVNNYITLGWFYRRVGLTTKVVFDADPKKSYKKAILNYQKAIQLDPGYKISYNNLGIVYNDLKMYDKAILNYQKAIALDTGYTLAYNNIGNVYYSQKAYDKAIVSYEKAIQLDTTFTSPYYNLGLIYDDLKAFDKSIRYYRKAIQQDSTDASTYISLGNVYYEQKAWDNSIFYYKKAITFDSSNPKTYVYLADAYHLEKVYDKAILNYQKAISIDSTNTSAYNNLGNVYYDQEIYPKAILNYRKVLHFDSTYTSAYYNLGLVYNKMQEYDKAIFNFQKAIKLEPGDKTAYTSLGDVYHHQKNYDKAILNYKKALTLDSTYTRAYNDIGILYFEQNSYSKAILYYQQAIRLDSTFSSPYYNLGLIYENLKEYDKALLYYHKSNKYEPDDASSYISMGNVYFAKNDMENSISNYKKGISLDTTNAKSYNHLGIDYRQQKKYDEAIFNFQKAIRVDSTNAAGYDNLGNVYDDQKNYDRAILCYKKALKLDSTFTRVYNDLGNVYYDLKAYNDAITNYQKAIHLDSSFFSPYYNLGLVYDDLKVYDKSAQYFRKAIKADSTSVTAYISLGSVYREQNAYDKAIVYYQKAISLDSGSASAYYNLGLAYDGLKAYDKSIIYYKKANTIDPGNSAYVTGLGYAYVYNGDFKMGIPLLEKSLSATPQDPWSYYNLACAWSLANDTGKSITYLKNALDKGFKDYDHILQDEDIANLKKTQDFNTLMKQYFPDKVK